MNPTLSLSTLVTGCDRSTINYDKHCKIPSGTYVQVHEQHNNLMMPQTSIAIVLRPSRNAQRSYFLNIYVKTGWYCPCPLK